MAGMSAVTLYGVTIRIERIQRRADGAVVHFSANDIEGGVVTFARVHGLGSAGYLSGNGGAAGWDVLLPPGSTTLTIDDVTLMESGTATIDLDIPETGSLTINRLIGLGRYPLLLKTGTWVDDPGNGHVFQIDFHTESVGGRQLGSWKIDGVGSLVLEFPTTPRDGVIKLDPNQPHSPPPGQATMTFSQPTATVGGPWVLPVR